VGPLLNEVGALVEDTEKAELLKPSWLQSLLLRLAPRHPSPWREEKKPGERKTFAWITVEII